MKLLLAAIAISAGLVTGAAADECPAGAAEKATALRTELAKGPKSSLTRELDGLAKAAPNCAAVVQARAGAFADDVDNGRLKVALDAYNARQAPTDLYALGGLRLSLLAADRTATISNGYKPLRDKIALVFADIKKLPEAEQPKAREFLFQGTCGIPGTPRFLYEWLAPTATCLTARPTEPEASGPHRQ